MSPEQTGRMNRQIDYRTDYYSFGVTLYELFTGGLPCESLDPLELVHFHVARNPMPPNEVNSELPESVSNIVLKLMAKNRKIAIKAPWGSRLIWNYVSIWSDRTDPTRLFLWAAPIYPRNS